MSGEYQILLPLSLTIKETYNPEHGKLDEKGIQRDESACQPGTKTTTLGEYPPISENKGENVSEVECAIRDNQFS